MRTDELIKLLSENPKCRNITRPMTTVLLAMLASIVLAVSISLVWLGLNKDVSTGSTDAHGLVVRLAFVFAIVGCACSLVRDLSVPGRPLRTLPFVLATGPFLFMAVIAVHELGSIRWDDRHQHTTHAWFTCLWQIGVLAVPAFAILMLAVRRLAPTRLSHAGFSIGLASGGVGAIGYTLHASHDSVAFSLTAYVAAILVIASCGAVLGPKILRWS